MCISSYDEVDAFKWALRVWERGLSVWGYWLLSGHEQWCMGGDEYCCVWGVCDMSHMWHDSSTRQVQQGRQHVWRIQKQVWMRVAVCVAVCFPVCVAVCDIVCLACMEDIGAGMNVCCRVGCQCVAVCGRVCCSVCCRVCCSVLQCVAVCCSVLQCVAVCCSMRYGLFCSLVQCATRTASRSATHAATHNATLSATCVHTCSCIFHTCHTRNTHYITHCKHCNTLQHTATHCTHPQTGCKRDKFPHKQDFLFVWNLKEISFQTKRVCNHTNRTWIHTPITQTITGNKKMFAHRQLFACEGSVTPPTATHYNTLQQHTATHCNRSTTRHAFTHCRHGVFVYCDCLCD